MADPEHLSLLPEAHPHELCDSRTSKDTATRSVKLSELDLMGGEQVQPSKLHVTSLRVLMIL